MNNPESKHYTHTFMVLSLLAKLLMMDSDSWKRELPVSATSAISWLTAIMIYRAERTASEIALNEYSNMLIPLRHRAVEMYRYISHTQHFVILMFTKFQRKC